MIISNLHYWEMYNILLSIRKWNMFIRHKMYSSIDQIHQVVDTFNK